MPCYPITRTIMPPQLIFGSVRLLFWKKCCDWLSLERHNPIVQGNNQWVGLFACLFGYWGCQQEYRWGVTYKNQGGLREQLHHREAHPSVDDASDLLNHKEFRAQSYQQAMQRAPGLLFSVGITHTGYTCILVEWNQLIRTTWFTPSPLHRIYCASQNGTG